MIFTNVNIDLCIPQHSSDVKYVSLHQKKNILSVKELYPVRNADKV